jgi:hypothetical protein
MYQLLSRREYILMRTGVIVAGGLRALNACEVFVTCRKRLGNRGSKATGVEFEKTSLVLVLLALARKETAEIPYSQYSSVKLAL